MSRVGNIIVMKRKEQKASQSKMCEELTSMGYPIKVSAYSSWESSRLRPLNLSPSQIRTCGFPAYGSS